MKNIKLLKRVSVFLTLVVTLGSISFTTFADNEFSENQKSIEMDTLDLNIAAATFLNSEDSEQSCILDDTYLEKSIPLFDVNNKKVAYYLTFTPQGYAVINNNVNNPAVIEFGDGKNPNIEKILESTPDAQIIYNNPGNIYAYNSNNTNRYVQKSQSGFYDYYPELAKNDSVLADQHNKFKQSFLEDRKMLYGKGDYNFVNLADLPYGAYRSKTINSAKNTSWAVTSDFDDIANNHCGATAVTNLALYFAQTGKSNLKINGSKRDTFVAVHKIIPDGPVMTIADGAKQYFKNRGYTLNYSSANDFEAYEKAMRKNSPCGVLLADGIVEWHWVIGIGYRSYYDDLGKYMQIVDGWNNSSNRYFKMNSGTAWISATKYTVD